MSNTESTVTFEGPERVLEFADAMQDTVVAPVDDQQAQWETWVTFRIGHETFGLGVAAVREIVRVQTVTRVPHAPFPVRGIINLRGRVVPVIDLRIRLGMPRGEITPQSRILICHMGSRVLGLLVDAADQVVRVDRSAVEAPPEDVMTADSGYVIGVYERDTAFLILLDAERVLLVPEGLASADAVPAPAVSTT